MFRDWKRWWIVWGLGLASVQHIAAQDRVPVIDTHTHCFAGAGDKAFPYHPRGPYKPGAASSPELLLERMNQAGVDYALVVHPEPYQDDHRYLEHCLAVGKGRLKGTCLFFADKDDAVPRMQELVRRHPGQIVALRIHAYAQNRLPPFGKPELKRLWQAAGELGLAVQLNCEPRFAAGFEPLIEAFPKTTVIIDHLGLPYANTLEQHATIMKWARFPNTVMKISGLPDRKKHPDQDVTPLIREMIHAFTPRRLIYGGGFNDSVSGAAYRAHREEIRAHFAHLHSDDQALIFGGNAYRLFGWDKASGATKRKAAKPVQVFLLAGQSNMQGYGHLRTLDWLGEDPTYGHLLKRIKNPDHTFKTRDDVWVYYNAGTKPKTGNLTVGFGVNEKNIGPELMFGNVMGDYFENQVLLIKTAWGGRSLAINFRPPSAGPVPLATYPDKQRLSLDAKIKDKSLIVGKEYQEILGHTRAVLANLKGYFPAYQGQGYEIAGFVWFQGWNDMIDTNFTAEYSKNLVHLIKDLRKDLNVPNLPVVIGEMGVGGDKAGTNILTFRKAQVTAVATPEFVGNVALAPTAIYWDYKAEALVNEGWKNRKWLTKELEEQFARMGSQPAYHYLGSAKIHVLMGYSMGQTMQALLKKRRQAR